MRKLEFVVPGVAIFLAMSGVTASALNPQPLPPGRRMTTQPATNHVYEPPNPCSQSRMQASNAGAGNVQTSPMYQHKGGKKSSLLQSNVHCLNPQPLPPG